MSTAADSPSAAAIGFRHLGDRLVHQGHFVRVVEAEFEAPSSERFTRDVVRSRGAVAVVPLRDVDGEPHVVLLRQYRPPYDELVLEIPAGVRDVEGEDTAVTARRELAEEAGLRAEHIEPLGRCYPSPGLTDSVTTLYLATGLSEVPMEPHGPEEEAMEVLDVPLVEALAMIDRAEIVDAKTVIGLLQTDRLLRRG